ncbi:MAG: hypothetical protein JKY34_01955, partial [Kordiimonadaceae bacterium]|nr:hypothetical protein [Kordiimonadaceae bacterium]
MAFFGTSVSFSSLFGVAQQQSFKPQIIGLGGSLITAALNAKLAQSSLLGTAAENSAIFRVSRSFDSAVVTPWEETEETSSLAKRVREVRNLSKFIDLNDNALNGVKTSADRTATFALFRAISNLRVLAEYASENNTTTSSLGRLDEQFQKGIDEVRSYISSAQLDKLDLFLGDKEYSTETATRLGKNETGFSGGFVADSADDVLTGLTGTEVFTVSITKGGVTDDITVGLSGISGDLSLTNVVDHINAQIEALTELDEEGE